MVLGPLVFLFLSLMLLKMSISEASPSSCSAVDPDAAANGNPSQPRIESVTTVASTQWLSLRTLSWIDMQGKSRKWDVATRTTKAGTTAEDDGKAMNDGNVGTPDAVVIIPLLKKSESNSRVETLLVEQYRPPVQRRTVEFPAGLIDPGESPENAALRELKEETGYVGERCKLVPAVSREVCMSPGLTDESVHCVMVEVDLDNPKNYGTPKPEPDDGEHITVRRVELGVGLKEVLEHGEAMPIMGLYLFALGFELGMNFGASVEKSN